MDVIKLKRLLYKYRFLVIHDMPFLEGKAPFNKNIEYFGLKAGTKILKMGRLSANGCITSSNRVLEFTYPATYVGGITIHGKQYFGLEFDNREVGRKDGEPYTGKLIQLFIAYEGLGNGDKGVVWAEKFRLMNTLQYAAEFKIVE